MSKIVPARLIFIGILPLFGRICLAARLPAAPRTPRGELRASIPDIAGRVQGPALSGQGIKVSRIETGPSAIGPASDPPAGSADAAEVMGESGDASWNEDVRRRTTLELDLLLRRRLPIIQTDGDVRIDQAAASEAFREYLARVPRADFDGAKKIADFTLSELSRFRAPIVVTRDPSIEYEPPVLMTWKHAKLDGVSRMKLMALEESMTRSGAKVINKAIPDSRFSIWARDAYFNFGGVAYIPDAQARAGFDFEINRKGELQFEQETQKLVEKRIDDVARMLREMGQRVVQLKDIYFEGGNLIGDALMNRIFWGDRHEWSGDSVLLSRIMRHFHDAPPNFIPVKTDRRHFHLDLGMSPMLPRGEFLVSGSLGYDGAGDARGYEKLKRYLEPKRMIFLEYADAEGFAANLRPVGNTLFMTSCGADLRRLLEGRGYVVNAPRPEDVGEFWSWWDPGIYRRIGCREDGGGVDCLTNELSPY